MTDIHEYIQNAMPMKKLLDVAHGKLIIIMGRHGILDIFMDISHTLEMTICVVNQLKNNSYC